MALSKPDEQEAELLKEFRKQLDDVLKTDEQKSDNYLIRWLRARDNDLGKAETMIRTSLKWRDDNGADKIFSMSVDPWFFENFPFYTEGYDKLGNPVTELHLGAWDMRKAINTGREEALSKYTTFFFETNLSKIREQNEKKKAKGEWPDTMWTVIVDWGGYSYAQFMHLKAIQSILKMAATYENHYPEILYKCFFINAPSIFPLVMGMLKTVIAPKTLNKIQTFGSDRKEWSKHILELVDAHQVGIQYGGTKERKAIHLSEVPQA